MEKRVGGATPIPSAYLNHTIFVVKTVLSTFAVNNAFTCIIHTHTREYCRTHSKDRCRLHFAIKSRISHVRQGMEICPTGTGKWELQSGTRKLLNINCNGNRGDQHTQKLICKLLGLASVFRFRFCARSSASALSASPSHPH